MENLNFNPPDSAGSPPRRRPQAIVVGGGPAGLMAAEVLVAGGMHTQVFDAMPSVGRKFLLAGKGGLNLTHSEPLTAFIPRYGQAAPMVAGWLARFGPRSLREFATGLGFDTFVGSSGRVFPADMKAGPMLRTWLRRLRDAGVEFRVRHRFTGWDAQGALEFSAPDGVLCIKPDLAVLALGGGSWAKLGSDGRWIEPLAAAGVGIAPLRPANCGFDCGWSEGFAERCQGQPLKSIAARPSGASIWRRGELMLTRDGIEGSLVYALSASLRDALERDGTAILELDLMPDRSLEQIRSTLSLPRATRSRSEHWRRRLGLSGVRAGLLLERLARDAWDDPEAVSNAIKCLPLKLHATRPLDEAISSTGGIRLDAVDERLMLRARPGCFVAGEMLDWEAPTGGYLLTASFASGVVAAEGALAWWRECGHAL